MIGLAPRHSRPSLRARLTRQIIFAIAALLASFSVLTLAAIAAHYTTMRRGTPKPSLAVWWLSTQML